MKLKILLLVTPLLVLADQGVKLLVVLFVPQGKNLPVIPNLFDLVHTTNRGAAFGAFADLPDSVRVPFFFVSSTIALAVIVGYFIKLRPERPSPFVALSLILGGAVGNIIDRIFRGEVIDYLSFHWYDRIATIDWGPFYARFRLEWPAFNIADAAISCSVIWLMFFTLRRTR